MKVLKDTSIKLIPMHLNHLSQMLSTSNCGNHIVTTKEHTPLVGHRCSPIFGDGDRVIRIKEFAAMISLSRSTIYDRLNPKSPRFDPTFPRPIKLGASAIGWHLVDVAAWISSLTSTN